jgi:hypothetical protein
MYNPLPQRVWSRVQNPCTSLDLTKLSYNSVYIPLTGKTTSLASADIQEKLQYKGNILQYKANSSQLTKNQKYSQISKALWCNRTKVFATQTQTYTNPNTTGLQRVNYTNVPNPNEIVGSPNNPSGPFIYPLPTLGYPVFDCSNNGIIQDGGSLLCGTYANPCTGEVTQTVYQQQCFPSYCSDVPGLPIELCWNSKAATYFPRQRYVMNNSANKWPQGYKGFVSALKPPAPTLIFLSFIENQTSLEWSITNNNTCIPITSFNIYQNGIFNQNVSSSVFAITITSSLGDTFYVTSLSTTIESDPSNTVTN